MKGQHVNLLGVNYEFGTFVKDVDTIVHNFEQLNKLTIVMSGFKSCKLIENLQDSYKNLARYQSNQKHKSETTFQANYCLLIKLQKQNKKISTDSKSC